MRPGFVRAVGVPVLAAAALFACGMSRTDELWIKATDYRNAGRCDKAEATSLNLRKAHPGSGALAVLHARDLACLGRGAEALAELEDAARLGYDDPASLRGQPEFHAIETDSRFVAVVATIEENQKKATTAIAAARDVPAPDTAPPAPTLAKLDKLLDTADREKEGPDDPRPPLESWAERLRRIALRVAAYERYAKEHPEAPDLEKARWEEIDARVQLVDGWGTVYATGLEALSSALDSFVTRFSSSDRVSRAGYLKTWISVAPLDPDGPVGTPGPSPLPRCDGMLDELRAKASGDASDPWVRRYNGLLALCLDATATSDTSQTRAAVDAYFGSSDDAYVPSDSPLRSTLLGIKFRLEGIPDFDAKTLDGTHVSLKSLRGKVTLLAFWSPG